MPLGLLVTVLRSRIALILFVTLATVAVSAYFTSTQPKRYVATASLLLNFVSENPFDDSSMPPQLVANYMATQVAIIASRNVASQVIDEMNLAETPAERETQIALLLRNLDVEPSVDSRLIAVHYEDSSPEIAAAIANSFARAYSATTQNLSIEPAKRNAERFDAQLELMRSRLGKSQAVLTAYQQDNGIVALDERLDTETTRLQNLGDALIAAQSSSRDVRARQLGVNHPDYQRAVNSERSIDSSVQEQKARVLELKQQRDELDVLARQVQAEEQSYQSTLQSYYNEQMRSSFSQAGVDVLDPAVPPASAATPNSTLNIAGGFFLGALLGVLLALAAELLFRRLRSPDDVEKLLDTRMLNDV
ncbi:MAG: GNVR domain-containing protein [Woeseia sp.]